MPVMRKSPVRGFTLVEIMIVVVIIGLLAAMAIPAFKKVRMSSLATRVTNDMKKLSEEFTIMLFENPALPNGIYNAGGVGVVPEGFNSADLPRSILLRPINQNTVLSVDVRASLAATDQAVVVLTPINGYTIESSLLRMIDERLDDGDLVTGDVRQSNSQLVYVFHRD